MNYYAYVNGHKVSFTNHATERAIERFKSLSIVFPDNDKYVDLAMGGVEYVLNNRFMKRYIDNLVCNSRNHDENVLVYDEVHKMVYALVVKPYQRGRIVVKTIGTELNDIEWLYDNKFQRLCWIYEDVFKFSTSSGNVTWY